MARSRFCKICQGWHDLAEPWPVECIRYEANAAPNIRPDGMDPIQSMVSGKFHDSKSAYYAEVRRAGCEIVGDDRAGFGKRPEYVAKGVGQAIKRAIEQLESRS